MYAYSESEPGLVLKYAFIITSYVKAIKFIFQVFVFIFILFPLYLIVRGVWLVTHLLLPQFCLYGTDDV